MPTGFSFVKYAAFSTDGASLVTVTADADVTFQRIEGSVIKTRKGPPFTPFGSRDASTPDVKFLAKFSQNDISLWRPADNQIKKWTAHSDEVTCIALSSDGQYLVSGSKDKAVKLWDHDGNLLKILSGHSEKIASVSFSIDNQTIISYSNDKTVMLWNTDGKLLNTFSIGSTAFSHKAVMSPNGKLIAIDLNSAVGLISPKGAALRQLGGHTSSLLELVFSPDSKIIASASRDKTIKIWSVENGQLLKTLVGHENTINSIGFSPDGRFLVSSSDDSTTRVWNVETGNHLAMLNQGQEWLIFNNDGYFDTSKNGGRLVAMVKGQTAFGIDQFAIKNNRPDLILSQVGIGSQQLIDYFNSRYQRRLKRAGIKEEDLSGEIHIPAVNIKNLKQTGKFVEVDFQLSDSKYNLKRYSLFVNDVPIFGTAGKEISGTSVELTENVELIGGKNKIEISVFNEKGAESYRDFRFIDYQAKVKGDLYYLGFGVSKYKYNELNLGYADQDARDLGALFSKLQKNYGKIQVKTILNEEVTVENIIKAKSFL
ncbi:WD40 repeat domain-containing protein, partial [bacterium]|nr:WD40 repeat domain-containing protein [bacterium]